MDSAFDLQTLTTQLADVEPPGPPQWWPWYVLAVLALALMVTIAQLVWRAYRRATLRSLSADAAALEKLQRLRAQWQGGQLNDRQVAFRLATLLRLGLGLTQLTSIKPPMLDGDVQHWQATVALLARLRYQPQPADRLSEEFFQQIQHWLCQAGGRAC